MESQTDAGPLEREPQLNALRARLDLAAAGTGSALVVAGPAGAGKTTLLRELAAGRTPGRILAARAAELERELPFGVVRQLVERPLLDFDAERRDALLAGPASPVRALLAANADAFAETAAAVAHGLYWVLGRMAEHEPVCVLVDDLQWADAPSDAALAYVARRLDGHRVLLVCAVRDDEPGTDGRRWGEEIEGAAALHLEPLSERACAQLVERSLGPHADGAAGAAFAAACHRVTAGNPRLVVELLRACRDEAVAPDAAGAARIATLAPAAVAPMVLARIRRLGPDAEALARAVAILDHGRRDDAAALAGLDDDRCAAAVEALVGAGVLGDELPLRFAHPLARTTVEADMPEVTRDRAHRDAARLLAARDPDAAALHLLRCEPGSAPWAVEALRGAARAALRRAAPAAAVRLLDRARAEGGGADVHAALTAALLAAGDRRAAGEMRARLAAARDPAERVRLAGPTAQAEFASGDVAAGVATLRAGLAEAQRVGAGIDDLAFAAASLGLDDPELQALAAERARTVVGDPRLEAFDAFDRFRSGRPASEVASRAGAPLRELSRLTGAEVAPTFFLAVFALAGSDETDAADAALDGAFELARERGSRLTYGLACYLRCWCRWRRGDVSGVLADVEESLVFAAEGWALVVPNVRWLEAECALLRGDPAGCETALAAGFESVRGSGWSVAEAWLLHGRSALRLSAGDAAGGLEDALACGALLEERRSPSPAIADWRGRAVRAAVALGDLDQARAIAADGTRRAELVGSPRTVALAYRADALVRGGAERVGRLEQAAAVAARGPARLVHAIVLCDLGAALRRSRRARDAREPLRQSLQLARECGATAVADRALAELEATGARRRTEPAWGVEALTPREHELARLAARDCSNTEIAERLFITRKTVESHLGAVYRKLDIASRRELADALARRPADAA
jgi:DNA-binding CsgD family transcriptional regulator